MAKRLAIPHKYVALEIVGLRDAYQAARIQRVTATADQATTTIDELGNSQHSGTSKDLANVTVTFQAMDVSHKLIATIAGIAPSGTAPLGFPQFGLDLTGPSGIGKAVDVIIRVRDETLTQYVKAAHLRRMTVQSFTYNYSVDGDSTEEYTAIGSSKRWFRNDVVVQKFNTGTTSFTLSETPKILKNGKYAMTFLMNGAYMDEVSTAPSTGQYRIVGTTLTTGDARTSQFAIVVYQSLLTGDAWTDVSDSTLPAAIKGKDVGVLIAASGVSRGQSITINGNFNPTPVREMGNREIVGYLAQVPEVTGTITVLDTDTDMLALLSGSSPNLDTEYPIGQCAAVGVPLEIKLYDPTDCTEPLDIKKSIYLPSISITSEGFTQNVNDNAQQTFDWRSDTGQVIVYSGLRAP
jgi:hypothetical protein